MASSLPRPVVVVGAVALAYHYSLLTLARVVVLEPSLEYLPFVPAVALALGWVALRRESAQRPIHDRQLDYIIGFALLLFAGGVSFLGPLTLGPRFWFSRVDLLTLPIFTAGIVTLVFGLRSLWTLRYPLAFLFLAWPIPYLWLIANVPPAAMTAAGGATPGTSAVVGFIVVGAALAYLLEGRPVRRALWLAAGLTFTWLLDVAATGMIGAPGRPIGPQTSLRAVTGALAFVLGALATLVLARSFELRRDLSHSLRRRNTNTVAVSPAGQLRASLLVTGAAALVVATVNAGYVRYETIANELGEPRLARFDVREAALANWQSVPATVHEDGKAFFGSSSTWARALYSSSSPAGVTSSAPIYVDAIDTDDPDSFAAYGLEAVYRLQGYRVTFRAPVLIAPGIQAQVVDYRGPKENEEWSALWWEWPYRNGSRTMYQRVVLFVANGPSATYEGIPADPSPPPGNRFHETNSYLTMLAKQLIARQIDRAAVP